MNKSPLISIIIPVYNVELYLNKCLDSIINQTYKNIEIIIVNDGSSDSSKTICEKFESIDNRITVINKSNGGASSARQSGISSINGEYAMIVDGDDWIDKDTIEVCADEIIKNQKLQCVLFAYVKEYPKNSIPVQVMDNSSYLDYKDAEDKIYRRLFGLSSEQMNHPERMNNMESCCMKLYKTETIKKGEFFDSNLVGSSEDALFNIYALYDLRSAFYINKPLYHYRKQPQSITSSYRCRLVEQWGALFNIMENVINEKHLDETYKNALDNRIALSIIGIGINELQNPNVGVLGHIKNIKNYINNPRYKRAIQKLDFKSLPIKWKVFLFACKHGMSAVTYSVLVAIDFLKKKVQK